MLLVTGATGHMGASSPASSTRKAPSSGSWSGTRPGLPELPEHAERAIGDLGQPATLAPAFDGVDGLFLLVPGIGTDHTAHALAAAQAAGLRRIVHLSSYAVIGDPVPKIGRWHHQREQMVRASGIPATIVRPSGFMTNALDWLPTIREGGYVLDPVGPGRAAPIDPADIAAVAALVLTEDGHQGAEYALTGDQLLTVTEQVRILAAAIGRDIEVREVAAPAEAVRFRYPTGTPGTRRRPHRRTQLMRADTAGFRTDTVKQLLGRSPRTFTDWCARNGSAFLKVLDGGTDTV